MSETTKKIKQDRPDLAGREDVTQLAEDLDAISEIAVLASTPGGKSLLKALDADIISAVEKVSGSYETASHAELQGFCATLRARLYTKRVLLNSEDKKDELTLLLKDILNS